MKHCKKCDTVKPVTEFHKDRYKKDGLHAYCRECCKASAARYRAANPEQVRAYTARYRAENPEKVKAKNARYRAENLDECRTRVRESHRKKREAEPLYRGLGSGAYRARKAGNPVEDFDGDDLRAYWKSQGIDPDSCVYCAGPREHLDHKHPISKGGAHSVENVVPSCARCNISKQDKTAIEFAVNRSA